MYNGNAKKRSDVFEMERGLDNLGLSKSGKEFVIAASDVFHDRELAVDGVPDFRTHRTIVQKITRTTTFSRPSTVAPGNNWNLHIFSTPINQTVTSYLATNQGTGQVLNRAADVYDGQLAGDGFGTQGLITCVQQASNNEVLYPPPTVNTLVTGLSPTSYAFAGLKPQDNYSSGQHRVFAAGFEVSMTANTLNDGGNVIVYRQAASVTESQGTINDVGARGFVALPSVQSRGPPRDVSTAMTLPGSRRWPAKQGCYVPLLLAENDLPFRQLRGTLYQTSVDTIPEPTATTMGMSPVQSWPATSPPLGPLCGPAGLSTNFFHCSGAFFEGINDLASLTVVACFYVEREPSVTESDLIVLARPSPPADELAWRVYSEMVRMSPAGVPVADNTAGAFFKSLMMGLATEVLPMVGRAVGRRLIAYSGSAGPAIARKQVLTQVVTSGARAGKPAKKRAAKKKKKLIMRR